MAKLIPLLSELCLVANGLQIPNGFAEGFVKLHGEDWISAQQHFEQIVRMVLDTDAIDLRATYRTAIDQAVRATVILLDRSDLRDRCPLCPRQSHGEVARRP